MSNQRNSMRNLWWGMVGTVVTSAVAILIPRLFIVNYGSEVNGLLASIRQVYVYLALLEAGVEYAEWGGVKPNPRLSHAKNGIVHAI